MKHSLSLLAFIFSTFPLWSKDTIQVRQCLLAEPIALQAPFLNDTVNTSNGTADAKFMLKTEVSGFAFQRNATGIEAGNDGFFNPNGQVANSGTLLLYSFDVLATQFTKARLVITTPQLVELYADGAKVSQKNTSQNSVATAGKLEYSLSLEPRRYRIAVKQLIRQNDTVPACLRAILVTDNTDCVQVASKLEKRPLELADILKGERVTNVSISASGSYFLASSLLTLDKGQRKEISRLFDYRTGKFMQSGDNRGWTWMPHGDRIYYVQTSDRGRSLMVMDIASMQETCVVDNLPEGSFKWTPDEKALVFSMVDKFPADKDGVNLIRTPEDRQAGWRNRSFLYLYRLDKQVLEPLTFGYRSTQLVDISPDSKCIIFSSSRDNYSERPFELTSYYQMNLDTRTVDTLWKDLRFGSVQAYSPDGKQLLLIGGPESFGGVGRASGQNVPNNYDRQVYIYDFATSKIDPISLHFDPSVKTAYWNRINNTIYMIVDEEDLVKCFAFQPKTRKFKEIPVPVDIIQQFDIANDATSAAYVGQGVNYPSQLFKLDVKTEKSTLILDPMRARMDEVKLGELHNWDFVGQDRTLIKGRFYLPYNFDPAKKYPLIVYYYGGTTPVDRTFDSRYPFHLYASMGYVVYVLQPSGAIGFGQEFSARHVNAWGKKTADNIIEGTKLFCEQHPFVNRSKIGCIGASYGGFMTMYLQTRTDMFAAAVSHAGISNVTSYWGEGYWGYSYNAVAAADSYPWNNPKLFMEQSPLFAADKIKTPLLLLHGAADTNVPVGESIQMFTALKILGSPVELITFDNENHFIQNMEKRTIWQNSIFAWFAKHLQGNNSWWKELYPERNL